METTQAQSFHGTAVYLVAALKPELNSLRLALGFHRVTGGLFGRRAILPQVTPTSGATLLLVRTADREV